MACMALQGTWRKASFVKRGLQARAPERGCFGTEPNPTVPFLFFMILCTKFIHTAWNGLYPSWLMGRVEYGGFSCVSIYVDSTCMGRFISTKVSEGEIAGDRW